MNYQKAMAHLTGPLASAIGIVSTSIVHSTVSHAVALNVATFVTSTTAAYLAHAKWFDNLAHWWTTHETHTPASVDPNLHPVIQAKHDAEATAERLRGQLRARGFAPEA